MSHTWKHLRGGVLPSDVMIASVVVWCYWSLKKGLASSPSFTVYSPKKAWICLLNTITIYNVGFIWNAFDMSTYLNYFPVMNLC